MDPTETVQRLADNGWPLGVKCAHCLRRALVDTRELAAKAGKPRLVSSLKFRCTQCGGGRCRVREVLESRPHQTLHGQRWLMRTTDAACNRRARFYPLLVPKQGRRGMTPRSRIQTIVRSIWNARHRRDVEGIVGQFAGDSTFTFHGRGLNVPSMAAVHKGKDEIRRVLHEFIDTWHFDEWRELDLLIDGEKAVLHWQARAHFRPNGRSHETDVLDLFHFRDGKVIDFQEFTDTAAILRTVSPR
jgi:ketosteroid isomerase-like protein